MGTVRKANCFQWLICDNHDKVIIMNLKDAFRYQNYLDTRIGDICEILDTKDYVTITKEIHKKSLSNPDAQDEILEVKNTDYDVTVNMMIDVLCKLLDEKIRIGKFITDCKGKLNIDIDAQISTNKSRQSISATLRNLGNIKTKESKHREVAYKLNNDGNQVSYYYNLHKVTSIDFDRNKVKETAKKLLKEADEVSTTIDRETVAKEFDFTALFDVNDTVSEIFEKL